jgi:hypothetical protein
VLGLLMMWTPAKEVLLIGFNERLSAGRGVRPRPRGLSGGVMLDLNEGRSSVMD